MSIVERARESELAGLEAIRDKLAADLEVSEASYSAQIAGRLDAVLARIEAVRKAQPAEGSRIDELQRKRAARSGDGVATAQRRASPRRNRDNRTG